MDDKKYDSRYDGETTDKILDNAKAIMEQTTAEDGETVQVYDTNGVPHKVSKTELLKKSTLALPALEDISSFVAVNAAGNAVGVMTKEQVASVLAGLTVRKMELGWLTGYTKLTDYADFGTMLIYITGDNRQSLIMLCDIQRVIMLHNPKQLKNIAKMSNCSVPFDLAAMIDRFAGNPKAGREVGLHYATYQIIDLMTHGVDGIHIYTMNKPEIAKEILKQLGE